MMWSALALVCTLVLFVRTVTVLNTMQPLQHEWRECLRFVAFGMSKAGMLAVAVGCMFLILDGKANVWAHLLVYSAGGLAAFERRK